MGRLPEKSSDASTSGGRHVLWLQDEPASQGRDSSQGLLIASGIFKRLVPGSPAMSYLGARKLTLKLARTIFQCIGEKFQLWCKRVVADA